MLKLHNTLSGKTEEFKSITDGKVGMYNCGPTVYDYAHIGNLRSYVFADTLRRTLEYLGFTVHQVINITDVGHLSGEVDDGEDKMTSALKREGKALTTQAMREVANFYFEEYKKDLRKLNIELPSEFPFASDHIEEDITLINILLEKKIAYKITDGIYFDVKEFPSYGKLGNIRRNRREDTESRIGINPEKKNYRDFALWKFNADLGYVAPFGKGFPGWHIECSAMSMKYLGETFDIHTGGIDHIPTHHNNEIAQSESVTGKPLANFWLHNAFVNVESGKMAKSEGNFITMNTLIEKKLHPIAYRYWLLQAHYSTQVNFTWDALESAQLAYIKLIKLWHTLPTGGSPIQQYIDEFTSYIEDDLDTPKAIALLWQIVKDDSVTPENKRATIVEFDKIFGLNLDEVSKITAFVHQKIDNLPVEIQAIISRREEVRQNKDFETSDKLRDELKEKGYIVEDKPEGPQITLRK